MTIKYNTKSPAIFGMTVTKYDLLRLKTYAHQQKLAEWHKITEDWSDGSAFAFAQEIGLDITKK
jgi:hypothetical protein